MPASLRNRAKAFTDLDMQWFYIREYLLHYSVYQQPAQDNSPILAPIVPASNQPSVPYPRQIFSIWADYFLPLTVNAWVFARLDFLPWAVHSPIGLASDGLNLPDRMLLFS